MDVEVTHCIHNVVVSFFCTQFESIEAAEIASVELSYLLNLQRKNGEESRIIRILRTPEDTNWPVLWSKIRLMGSRDKDQNMGWHLKPSPFLRN